MMATEFETEWEINGHEISLRKVEYNKAQPIPLSYGRGNGFRSGVGRQNTSDKPPVEKLWVQGGEKNIDFSKYGSHELRLPLSQTLTYENNEYISDEQGLSIKRKNVDFKSHAEDSYDGSNVYPSRVGEVSLVNTGSLVTEDGQTYYNHCYFYDSSIPQDLNFLDCLIAGQTLNVEFQTGMLTGKVFDVNFQKAASGTPNLNRFGIVPQEIDGMMMPNEAFIPVFGDKYAVFGMMLPEQYICDNNTQSGAAWDLFREAAKYFYENQEPKFTFIGELDPIFARANWADLSPKLLLGGYINFSDTQFQPDGIPIRIVGIKDFINNPYYPTLELSNDIIGASVASELGKIGSNEVLMETINRGTVQMFNRTWRDVKETQAMLEALELDGFTAASNPVVVNTMQLIAGSPQCQFYFVNGVYNPSSNPDPTPITYQPTWNSGTKQLVFPAGAIKHLTLGIDVISNVHSPNEYRYSRVGADTFSLTDPNKTYYAWIYAYASMPSQTGKWQLSETPPIFHNDNNYKLLAFLVGREINGQRNVTRVFGFTEILPGQITTDMIRSSDGKTYFDLVNNIVRGKFDFRDGLISSMIALTSSTGVVTAGLQGDNNTDVGMWLGGTYEQALNNVASVILRKSGTAKIGLFDVTDNEVTVSDAEKVRIQIQKDNIVQNYGDYVPVNVNETQYITNQPYNDDEELFFRNYMQSTSTRIFTAKISDFFSINNGNNEVQICISGNNGISYTTTNNTATLSVRAYLLDINTNNKINISGTSGSGTNNLVPPFNQTLSPALSYSFQCGIGASYNSTTKIATPLILTNLPLGTYCLILEVAVQSLDAIANNYCVVSIFKNGKTPFYLQFTQNMEVVQIGKNGIGIYHDANDYCQIFTNTNGEFKFVLKTQNGASFYKDSNGKMNVTLLNLPTSNQGLNSGQLYKNGNALMITS
jgi:hypothetical protein